MNKQYLHNRRSIRLKNYDYSSEGLYFITLCSEDRKNIFGEISDGELILNPLGEIAKEEWLRTPKIRPNLSLGEYIIMPNHLHGIIHIDYQIKKKKTENTRKFESPSQTIGAIIRGFKGATTKRINIFIREIKDNSGSSTGELQFAPTDIILSGKGSIWQRNYYEHIIKTEKAYENISNYIINNPKNWLNDKFKQL